MLQVSHWSVVVDCDHTQLTLTEMNLTLPTNSHSELALTLLAALVHPNCYVAVVVLRQRLQHFPRELSGLPVRL